MNKPSHPSMLPRFEGDVGKQRLAEVLERQTLIGKNAVLAGEIVKRASLIEVNPGTPEAAFIQQGGADVDIYFIVSGAVDIQVNGRPIATRFAGTHVGEMALIDPTARRSATVVAIEPCVLARVAESDFSDLAQQFPHLWRGIAVEIANRLRERNRYIKHPHNQPVLFIGSSSERLKIAQELQRGLDQDPIVVTVWTNGIFKASRLSIENLVAAVNDADFAALVISTDDFVESRGIEHYGPRDNILFEMGLFMGGLGRERTYMIKPRGVDIKVPSDLFGITPLEYAEGEESTLTSRLGPVCTELRNLILQMGPR